jgi:uncharacterized RDD family membrane protein YckC
MTTPSRAEDAGVVSRAVAYAIDIVVVAVVAFGIVAGIQLFGSVLGGDVRDLGRATVPVIIAVLPWLLISYNVAFWGLTGRTPGMALLGIRVISTGGRRASWLAALIRAVVLGYFPIGALWCLVDRRHQGVHDKVARTLVVRSLPEIATPPGRRRVSAVMPAGHTGPYAR